MAYNLAGNAFYLASFAALLPPQVYLGIRYKTWGFLFGMFSGLVLEVIGYTARVQMHFGQKKFLIYIVTLTIGPAFFSAAIYLCLARVITVYGQHLSRFQPRTYTITFMCADLIALLLQASGGALAAGSDISRLDKGVSILQAGLSFHLIAMALFVALSAEYGFAAYRNQQSWNLKFHELQKSKRFRAFLLGLIVATIGIFIRTLFRVAELSQGFSSPLAQNEDAFMVLEGMMVLIAAISLTVCHPGTTFKGLWTEANFQLKGSTGQTRSPGRRSKPQAHVPLESINATSAGTRPFRAGNDASAGTYT